MQHTKEKMYMGKGGMAMVKTYEELELKDDFMFSVIMRDPRYVKPFLETILRIKIAKIEYPEVQKNIDIAAGAKGIRLDVYVEDEKHTVFNLEMQTTTARNLPKRMRYYQGMIDLNILEKGDDYNHLKKSYVIFICTFDPFGLGRHIYTFEKKNFSYPFFGDKDVDDRGEVISSFRKLILRNGGNCAFTTKFNDTYWQKQLADLKVETQASRPCVVYLNGEYWGLYILQEDYQAKYFEKTHGVAKENVVTYKGDAEALSLGYKLDEGKLPEGEDNESYYLQDVLDFFASHDNLRNEQDYEAFAKLVDPESVRDYFAANVWLNNKWDWPGKNWTIWKTTKVDPDNPYADGRWRLCFYDLDFGGVSGVEDIGTNTMAEDNYKKYGLLDKKTANPLVKMFVYLMSNDSFRRDFEDKLLSLSENELEKEHALAECKKIREIYEPLYPQFFTRYFGTEQAEYKTEDAIGGGYASYQCLVDFLGGRADTIPGIVNWIEKTEKRLE